jgi:uncharacterized protein involved in response to NO
MSTSAAQIRSFTGPALLSYGFRPFFLFGALWAAFAVVLWLPMLSGHLDLPSSLSPIEWHVHELIYGYVPAIVAGFLLTAVPNWTGRLPVVGMRLAVLFGLWIAGRIAIFFSDWIGGGLAAAVDLSFLAMLGLVIAREIIAGKSLHNLKVLAGVALLLIGNALFHLEAVASIGDGHGTRLGIAAAIFMIMLIGGRIVPSFTRNWLARFGPGRLPVTFGRFDLVVMVASGGALASWVIAAHPAATSALALAAAVLNVARLGRWAGERTADEPLVLILHVAYAFVPVGFFLLGLASHQPGIVAPSGALHAWTTGAIGVMTLAVMTRASLGHLGRPLTATYSILFVYIAAVTAVLFRIVAAFAILREPMLYLAATAWILAFSGFVVIFARPMLQRRGETS